MEESRDRNQEAHLRDVLAKCHEHGDLISKAAAEMGITETMRENLAEIGLDFGICDSLAFKAESEAKTGVNYFIHWTYSSSLAFVTTTITTIGYGNLVPKTAGGKIATIFISLLGIPLSGFFLVKTARVVSTLLLWYSHLLHKRVFMRRQSLAAKSARRKRQTTGLDLVTRLSKVDFFFVQLVMCLIFCLSSAIWTMVAMRGKFT